jgi:ethanolamine ammonia-lyase small subunit
MSDWESLKKYTQARIGLGRVGYAVSTKEHLKFQFDHARARDAVHWPWEIEKFQKKLKSAKIPSQVLKTRITSRQEYLTRPDLGKLLGPNKLKPVRADIAIVVSNGLSSSAVENHGVLFLKRLWNQLESEFKLAPVCLVENARVALTSFDSLALYLTYAPKLGNSDAQRNCISNIRPPDGLSYETAVKKTLFLVSEAFRRKISGVELKEEADLVNIRQNSDGGQLT